MENAQISDKSMEEPLQPQEIEYIKNIYYNPRHPASYSGIDKLLKVIKKDGKHNISRKKLQNWLSSQSVYTNHRYVARKTRREKIISASKHYQWELDTVSMIRFSKSNDGYKYIMVAIDVMSKFAKAVPMKNLTADSSIAALNIIFKDIKPTKARSDKGAEFISNKVQNYFREQSIDHFTSQNEVKSAIVERFIKTLKSKLTKYMDQNETYKWVDVLDDVVDSYNQTFHSTIKMSPMTAQSTDDFDLYKNIYFNPIDTYNKVGMKFRFNVDDRVKISYIRKTFQRAYDRTFTEEIFTITERFEKQGVKTDIIKDLNNEAIKGRFLENELQKVFINENTTYKIEKLLKTRKRRGVKEYLVRWLGYSSNFDSWVKEDELEST